jgi:hypothetical protein
MLTLHDHFEMLRAEQPKLTAGREPLGGGAFGLVISGPDDTAVKVLWKPGENHPQRFWSEQLFNREIAFFKAMENIPVRDIDIPRLVNEPTPLKSRHFMATYTMTRLSGQPEYWQEASKPDPEPYHRRLGGALSRLHEAFSRIDPVIRREFRSYDAARIVAVDGLDDELNQRLQKADRYLQAHKRPGFIHGDFHAGNVMITKPGKPLGLFDFSFASYSDNFQADASRVLQFSPDYFPAFLKGYEEAGGEPHDALMAHLTALSGGTQFANQIVGQQWYDDVIKGIKKNLEQSSRILKNRERNAPAF